uniref:transmembrane protein 256 homolog n=1 Tax=Myxine glutinosa TaxID=7769 RepID=UPI00358F0975
MAEDAKLFLQVAGVSGALAVGLGAYDAHGLRNKEVDEYLKQVFETANRYHFLHTLALLGTQFSSRPRLTGSLMTLGMTLFSGSCYLVALTGSRSLGRFAPFGGLCLMVAWLTFLL